jgi:hypothetical protein
MASPVGFESPVPSRARGLGSMLLLLLALALAGFALGLGLARIGRQAPVTESMPAPHALSPLALPSVALPPVGAAPPLAMRLPPLPVRFRGDAGAAGQRARDALVRVLATRVGARARQLMESGALPGPITIEVNDRGDHFTRYRIPGRELGETIVFDPDRLPLVETEEGPLRALPETVLAHELGHAVFKLVSEEAVIHAIENPIRDDLGLPRRRRF